MKKKFLTLQNKLIILMSLVIISFAVILSVFFYLETLREARIVDQIRSTNKVIIENTIKSRLKQNSNLAKDYSVWDDMYNAVQSKNIDWIIENTESLIQTYEIDHFAIYTSRNNCLFSNFKNEKLLVPKKIFKGNYGDFFILNEDSLIQVSWSVITITSDTARERYGVGYLVVAKNWDNEFLGNFEKETGLSVFFDKSLIENDSLNQNFMYSDGKIISSMSFKDKDFIAQIEKQRNLVFLITLFGIIVILLFFLIIIRRHVTKPIGIILNALSSKDISSLDLIKSEEIDDEWDILADLIRDNIKKTKELEAIIKTKDKFFDIIAHDLRSPFTAILGFSQMLKDDWDSLDEESKKKIVDLIVESSNNTYKLIEKLLGWARLQTGRWIPNIQSFDIGGLIQNVVNDHQIQSLQRKIEFNFSKKSFLVSADEDMISTTLRNLISNAIKFTPTGGCVSISITPGSKDVTIVISDTGKGMSNEILNSLFKIGEDVISLDASGKLGTGLGLILCKELIDVNKGTIWAESELGKGSKFYLTIPLD